MANTNLSDRSTLAINFYILAGGKSRRFGENKALFKIGRRAVIETVIAAIPPGRPVFIVTNSPADYAHLGLPTLPDNYPNAGPLAGIHAGLSHSPREWNFFLACDFPSLRVEVIEEVLAAFFNKYKSEEGAQVILPETAEGLQPLCALWAKSTLSSVEAALNSGQRSVRSVLVQLSLHRISLSKPEALLNLNTPEDLAKLSVQKQITRG
jgi:molybdopterin-guanine dinucleotide biosynthesis protein A